VAGSIDYNNQEDPMLLLLRNSTETQYEELQIQGGASTVLQDWSEGAAGSISASDEALEAIAAEMTGQPTTSAGQEELTKLNALYNVMQTKYSNLNNQYSNIMQGGSTIVTDLTQTEQQALQLCQVTVDFQNNTNQLITSWQ